MPNKPLPAVDFAVSCTPCCIAMMPHRSPLQRPKRSLWCVADVITVNGAWVASEAID